MKECSLYWSMADYLPLNQVVSYWCEKSGFADQHCREAKSAAIASACEKGLIRYSRNDGKDFQDAALSLANRGILTVERESFDAWVMENFEDESPLPEKPLGTNERRTLLVIIAALCREAGLDWRKGKGAPANIVRLTEQLGTPISEDTIRKQLNMIDDAIEARQKP